MVILGNFAIKNENFSTNCLSWTQKIFSKLDENIKLLQKVRFEIIFLTSQIYCVYMKSVLQKELYLLELKFMQMITLSRITNTDG